MRQSTLDMDDLRKRRSLVITRKEAAEALGVDPRTITRSINDGTIPHVRHARRILIPRAKFIPLSANTAKSFVTTWATGAGTRTGTHTIKVGVYGPSGTPTYSYTNRATISVTN